MSAVYGDFFNGLESRVRARGSTQMGPQSGKTIQDSGDFGATLHITDRLRLNETFHFMNWRNPSFFQSATIEFTVPTGSTVNILFPFGSTQQVRDDVLYGAFLQVDQKTNQIDLEYDISDRMGARIGHRYSTKLTRHAVNDFDLATGDPITDDNFFVPTHTHTGLVGFWARPIDKLRLNADFELGSADNFEFRTEPRRVLNYKLRATYNPVRWATLSANGNFLEERNRGGSCSSTLSTAPCSSANPVLGTGEINFNGHNRNVGVSATLMPNERYAFDFNYNYSNVASNGFICYQIASPGSQLPGTFSCVNNNASGAPFEVYQTYGNQIHFADVNFIWKPVKRVSTNIGYSVVSSDGQVTTFNPLQPTGTLRSTFHRPLFGVEFEMAKRWYAKAGWNYYGYGETGVAGPTLPRDFHANNVTLSLKYAF